MALSLMAAGAGCNSKGEQLSDEDGPDMAEPGRVDLAMAAAPPVLTAFADCGPTLFADGTLPQDLSSQMAFDAGWGTAWAKPTIKDSALGFGPHPLSADWWENYSPATSLGKPGDVLICARVRLTTQTSDPADDNSFELTMRNPDGASFETSGMVLLLSGNASTIALRTRTGSSTWVHYGSAPLRMLTGNEATYELLLFAQGQRFIAEVKNRSTGEIARLRADSQLPEGGAVTLLGWRSRNGITVDKLVMGQPSVAAQERLTTALTPLL